MLMETDLTREPDSAHAYGHARADAGASAADVVRELSARGADGEMLARAVAGWEEQRQKRREQWLSFLVHDLKNPLNTVLNALWLLREKGSDPKQAARFLELAERAVKRLETRCRDVRELDEDLLQPPPGWEAPQARP